MVRWHRYVVSACVIAEATFRHYLPCEVDKAAPSVKMVKYNFPSFEELPKVEGAPQGCIWGFYDKAGQRDEIGGKL